jgi:hypothetical protein
MQLVLLVVVTLEVAAVVQATQVERQAVQAVQAS